MEVTNNVHEQSPETGVTHEAVSLPGAGADTTQLPTILQVNSKLINEQLPATVAAGAEQLADTIKQTTAAAVAAAEIATNQLFDRVQEELTTAKEEEQNREENKNECTVTKFDEETGEITQVKVTEEEIKPFEQHKDLIEENTQILENPLLIERDNLTSEKESLENPILIANDKSTVEEDVKEEEFENSNSPKPASTPTADRPTDPLEVDANVLDIESHLIETYDECESQDSGVGIKELPPVQDELTEGTSKIETASNVRSIVEVEPVGVELKQPIKTDLQLVSPQQAAEESANVVEESEQKHIKEVAERLVHEIEEAAIAVVLQVEKEKEPTAKKPRPKITLSLSEDTPEPSEKQTPHAELKLISGPVTKTQSDAEERKLFIESLPPIETNTDASKLSADCKQEYYKSLRKYLTSSVERPPVPLQTYRWEDLRRAKERGGYPWTHLYKRPLGPNEEPEIVLLLRKSQEFRFASESPKSLKKVRIDQQVIVTQTSPYAQELLEDEELQSEAPEENDNHSLHSESTSCVSDSVLATGKSRKPSRFSRFNRFNRIRNFLRRRSQGSLKDDSVSLPRTLAGTSPSQSEINLATQATAETSPSGSTPEHKNWHYYNIMKKLKTMADRQKKRLQIKHIKLKKDERIVLGEETKILNLKNSPKNERSEIPRFIEKQDSDDVLEIEELDESPSRKYRVKTAENITENGIAEDDVDHSTVVEPDEVIDIAPVTVVEKKEEVSVENVNVQEIPNGFSKVPPKKAPRLRREHVYEEIAHDEPEHSEINNILDGSSVEALKKSLVRQDDVVMRDIEHSIAPPPLDRMGTSSSIEEEPTVIPISNSNDANQEKSSNKLLAPISSVDSTSDDEERNKVPLPTLMEEADTDTSVPPIIEQNDVVNLKPLIKKENSPAPSDKKVTFSHVEDEAEPHREDIDLPDDVIAAAPVKTISEHEYEPIGVPQDEKPAPAVTPASIPSQPQPKPEQKTDNILNDVVINEKVHASIEIIPPTSDEGQSDQADSISLDAPPLKDSRKHSFMASAQDRTRKLRTGFKNQAGKIKSKLRSPAKHTLPPSESVEETKEQKRFKGPDFSHFKFSGIKRPNVSKLKEIKYPEFAKFNKPDMSKFKLPEKFTTMKLRRSKSFKENEPEPENATATTEAQAPKKMFDFNFGTYPRAFRKKKKPVEPQSSFGTETGTEAPSTMPSTGTQASVESSSSPQGDRGPGPVRSNWAHKLNDITYNESEGSRYRSDQGSFDRESSVERRMKDTLERNNSETAELEILGGVTESKQFAEFDEENRAIHEISNLRAGEFRRRPLPHQDSDLRSEDSKDAVGWTDSEIQKNRLLRKAEMEAEASYLKYPSIEAMTQETQSTASSGKKVVMEEIDDDEFFLRKRGISEDNIELRQYISDAIREGYDEPLNTLKHVGRTSEPLEFSDDYRVPPPKPRRLNKGFRNQNILQDTGSMHSDFGDDLSMSQNGSDFISSIPKAPMRKARSRSKYSMDSQDVAIENDQISQQLQYFDDDEDYLRPPNARVSADDTTNLNDLNISSKHEYDEDQEDMPQAPTRKKRQQRESSLDKNSYIEEFMGRSISNSFLQAPGEQVIVYRTEHEYHHIPLATPENYTPENASTPSKKSRTPSYFDEEMHAIKIAQLDDVDGNLKDNDDLNDKFVIDMMESDGYAIVRKEYIPKPTPPARRKKFTRSPGERFATMPGPTPHSTEPPARPPPPESYTPSLDGTQASPIAPRSMSSLDAPRNYDDDFGESDDYERAGSPRNLQSGEVINKMKFRPLPPPPRPPREKRQRSDKKSVTPSRDSVISEDNFEARLPIEEIEVSTQTDPLPDDFECEEFEITEDMRVIEPRYQFKTLDELLQKEQDAEVDRIRQMAETEQLQQSVQRFRDANQRSLSEKSRTSSQADRSRSLSRPQTPSALVIERRVSTPVPNRNSETMLEASLTVQPIDDLDLEEEALRREGLLSDSSHHSKSDLASNADDEGAIAKEFKQPEETVLSEKESEITESTVETEEEDTLMPYLRKYHEQLLSDNSELSPFDIDHLKNEYLHGEKYLLSDIEELSTNVDSDQQEDKEKLSDLEQTITGADEQPEKTELSDIEQQSLSIEDEIKALRLAYESKLSAPQPKETIEKPEEVIDKIEEQIIETEPSQPPPQPPPRRKSAPQIEQPTSLDAVSPFTPALETTTTITSTPITMPTTTIATSEPSTSTAITEQALAPQEQTVAPTLSHLEQLEVERASVGALQAGQVMVSQMHGGQISAENFDCKSGNIIVQNIELPTGFIEDIVQRVRRTEHGPAITTETQTSLQASAETLLDETTPRTTQTSQPQGAVQTHTESRPIAPIEVVELVTSSMQTTPIQSLPPSYPQHFVEQVQTQPRPVYAETSRGAMDYETEDRQRIRRPRRRRYRDYSSSEYDDDGNNDDAYVEQDEELEKPRHRSRSRTQPREVQPTVMQAGRQFISACALSLVRIINHLTDYVRGNGEKEQERQIPTLVVLFIGITFALIIYLLSRQSIHTHHWDFFNLPGNNGRPT